MTASTAKECLHLLCLACARSLACTLNTLCPNSFNVRGTNARAVTTHASQTAVMDKPRSKRFQRLKAYVAEHYMHMAPLKSETVVVGSKLDLGPKQSQVRVSVSREDTLVCAERLSKERPGARIAVLNMANSVDPGLDCTGNTQEEALIHRTLFLTHGNKPEHYPIAPDEVIFSAQVPVVFGPDFAPLETPFAVDIISGCAPALARPRQLNRTECHQLGHTMDAIFYAAVRNQVQVLVLGPLGNGAFRNLPAQTVQFWNETLDEYRRYFVEIVFACMDDPNGANYTTYRDGICTGVFDVSHDVSW
jgi:uncharacterized protein (TIGR02452 family)